MNFLRKHGISLGLLIAPAVLGCGPESSTPPTNGGSSSVPTITSVQPASIAANNLPQTLSIVGSGFGTAPSVTVVDPGGTSVRLTGADLASASATNISVNIVFATAGTWRIQVGNENGQTSATTSLSVVPAGAPVIQSVSPNSLPVGSFGTITVKGTGFQLP